MGGIFFEGDTKIIRNTENDYHVLVEANDFVFTEYKERKFLIKDKGVFSAVTAGNIFSLLSHHDISNHYIRAESADSFLAEKLMPVPVKLVISSKAVGNYLIRHPEKNFGDKLYDLNIDWFYKEDSVTNRYMKWNGSNALFDLYSDHKLIKGENFKKYLCLKDVEKDFFPVSQADMQEYEDISRRAFEVLAKAWATKKIELVQLKLSFGFNEYGELVIGDSINNDYMDLWPNGDSTKSYNKNYGYTSNMIDSVFRNMLHQKYKTVATSSRFRLE